LYWFILSHDIDVLIDTSCGDQQWAPALRKMLPALDYIGMFLRFDLFYISHLGIDVVPAVIQYNRETFGIPGRIEFFLLGMLLN
jgi:hypothetical protein